MPFDENDFSIFKIPFFASKAQADEKADLSDLDISVTDPSDSNELGMVDAAPSGGSAMVDQNPFSSFPVFEDFKPAVLSLLEKRDVPAVDVEFPEVALDGLAVDWPEETEGYDLILHEGACGCSGCCMKLEELTRADGDTQATTGGEGANAPGILGDMAEFLLTGYWNTGFGDGTRSHNVTSSGTDANDGVLHYNLSGYSSDADGVTAERADLIREVFKVYEATLGIQFVETDSTDTNLVDFFFSDNSSGAYAGSSYYNSGAWGSTIHYAYINVAESWSGGTSTYDDYTLQTIFHEVGHAIGLGHQGSYNGSATYGVDNTFDNDSWQASMMSYFSQTENSTITASYEFLQTPMAVDWLALDEIYGRQGFGTSNAFTEDTVWGFNTTITSEVSDIWAQWSTYGDRTASTIVDSGGIDTLDLSGYGNNTLINLAPSDAGSTSPSLSNIGGKIGNLAISHGTIIENAIGGSGSETFYGNVADNSFSGNGGNDTFHDSAGSDTYNGGAGTDYVIFGQNFGAYTIDIVGGVLQVIDAAIDWVEDTIEWLTFSDQTLSWQAVADSISPNTAPVANDDAYSVGEDDGLSVSDFLGNDTDVEGDTLSVATVNGIAIAPGVDGQVINLASGATLTVYANGAFDYDSNGVFDYLDAGEQATDSFTYTASDGRAQSAPATVTITIDGAFDNAAPVALSDAFVVDEDAALTGINVLTNDNDPDGDALNIVAIEGQSIVPGGTVELASGAEVTLNADGTLDYVQNGAFDYLGVGESADETFTYSISDGTSSTDATVTVTVNGTFDNSAPTAANDAAALSENETATGNVLGNDGDVDGDALSVTAVNGSAAAVGATISLASGALLTLGADGAYTYDPNGAFDALEDGQIGTDSFTYTVSDGQGGVDTATVNITIDGISPPTSTEAILVDFEGMATGSYTGQNGLGFAGINAVSTTTLGGTMAGNSGNDGTFSITASGEDFDLDGFSAIASSGRLKVLVEAYDDGILVGSQQINLGSRKASDASFDTTFDSVDEVVFTSSGAFLIDDIAMVTRSPGEPGGNLAPIAVNDDFTTDEGTAVGGNLLANDSDPDGDALSLVSVAGNTSGAVTLGSGATVTFAADGSFSYDPNGAFDDLYDGQTGEDSFTYEISDGQGGTDSATATIAVAGTGPAPSQVVLDFESGLSADGFGVSGAVITTADPGVASGSQAAASTGDSLSVFALSGESFDFDGGVFTASGRGRVDILLEGYLDGTLVGTQTVRVRAGKEESVSLSSDFDAVDDVLMTASGGVVVDDLTFFI